MRHLIIIPLLIATCHLANAQRDSTNTREKTSISFGGQMEIPSEEYSLYQTESTFGYGGSFLTRNRIPWFQSGINFTYGQTGKFTDEVSIQEGETYNGTPVFGITDLTVKHKIYRTHGVLRFKPFKGMVQPYIDGMAGMKVFASSAKMEQGEGRSKTVLDRYNIEKSLTSSFGWAAGLKVEITNDFFVEGRYEHMTGGTASYIDEESLYLNASDKLEYDLHESRTNSSLVHLGISIDF